MANQPLRWDNISGPDFRDAALFAENSRRGMDAATKSFTDIIQRRNDVSAENWDTAKANNTNALLAATQAAKTPEEFAAMEAGLREQMLGYGAQVDQTAGRNALDGRLATLQQRGLADMQYTDKVTDNREAPIKDQIASLTSAGKFGEAQALMDQHTLRNEAALSDALRVRQRGVVTEGQADTKFGFDQAAEQQRVLERPLAIDKLKSDLLSAEQNRLTSAAQAESYSSDARIKKEANSAATLQKAALAAAYKDGIYGGGDYSTNEGQSAFISGLAKIGFDKSQTNDALAEIGKQYPRGIPTGEKDAKGDPVYAPIPVNLLLEIAGQSEDNSLAFPSMGWSRRGDNLVNLLDERLKMDPHIRDQIQGGLAIKSKLIYEPLADKGVVSPIVAPGAPAKPGGRFDGESALDAAVLAAKKKAQNQR